MNSLKQKLIDCKSESERIIIVANLSDANLRNADLRDADLRNAALRNVDMYNADLRNADLSDSNLCDANLCDANLCNVRIRICSKWTIQIHSEKEISIGCKRKKISEWNRFFKGKDEIETKRDSIEFKEIQLNFEYAKLFIKKYKGQFKEAKK